MDILQLKYFQKVAQLEHMTNAARELNIVQPSLSMTIARLEEDLGVPLFDRQGRQIKLNAYGRAFLKKVNSALLLLEEGRREITDMAGLERGSVSFAATTLSRFSNLLGEFISQYPHTNFRIIQSSTEEEKLKLLQEGDIDFYFSYRSFEKSEIRSLPILTEEIMLAVPPNHRLADKQRIRLEEVAEDSFISLKSGYGFRDITDKYCKKAGFIPNIICESDEPAALGRLVNTGLGVSFMPAAAKTEDPCLHLLHVEEPELVWTLYLTWLEKHYLSQAAQTFSHFVIAYFTKRYKNGMDTLQVKKFC